MKEMPPQFAHPPMFEIVGSTVASEEVNRRLTAVFNELPRLWTDYAAQMIEYKDNGQLTAEALSVVLERLSLRPFVFFGVGYTIF